MHVAAYKTIRNNNVCCCLQIYKMIYSSLNILHVVNFLYIHFDLQGICTCILCNTKFSLMSKCLGTKAIVVKRVHSNVNRIENRIE